VEASREELARFFTTVLAHLNELQCRVIAGAMPLSLGHGGKTAVADVSGMSRNTVIKAEREVVTGIEPSSRQRDDDDDADDDDDDDADDDADDDDDDDDDGGLPLASPGRVARPALADPGGELPVRSLRSAGTGTLVMEETTQHSGASNRRGCPVSRCHHSDGIASLEESARRKAQSTTGVGLRFAGLRQHFIEPEHARRGERKEPPAARGATCAAWPGPHDRALCSRGSTL
jgi:hypothetical protein